MKILITEPEYFPPKSLEIFETLGKVVAKRLSRSDLFSEISDTDILVVRIETKVDRELISAAPKLKVIASATTGLNHIDVEYAKARGIKTVNLSGTHTIPTAEHTFALLLSLARKVHWAHSNLVSGKWERHKFLGREMNGKTIGIIGLGRIGRQVARYALAFGMKVVAYDPYVEREAAKSAGAELVSLDELLEVADVVSIHAVLTDETREMIGVEEIAKMKPAALMINTARAEIVNVAGLIKALESGRIAGAAFDVFVHEPSDVTDPLVQYAATHSNLLLTPHLGASTEEAVDNASVYIANETVKAVRSA